MMNILKQTSNIDQKIEFKFLNENEAQLKRW